MKYPQRWLREAEAVTSPEGWRKQVTNELLKCQKGLEDTPEEPQIKNITLGNIPESINLYSSGHGTFSFSFSYEDEEYTPKNILCNTYITGSGTVNPIINKFSKTVTVDIKNVENNTTTKIDFEVEIDNIKSPIKSTNAISPSLD